MPPTSQEEDHLLKHGVPDFISWFCTKARTDAEMSDELKQVGSGFPRRVNSFTVYDVNGYRFRTISYEESRPNCKKPLAPEFVRPAQMRRTITA